jgi:DNA ligase-1
MLAAKPKQKPGEKLDDVIERIIDNIDYPVLGSVKLDGIRFTVQGGKLLSRSLKPIRNQFLQKQFGRKQFNGLDGEFITGPATAADVFQRTTSAVMSSVSDLTDEGNTTLYVFDWYSDSLRFSTRLTSVEALVQNTVKIHGNVLKAVRHKFITKADDFRKFERWALDLGYEGVMARDPNGAYKQGRSTLIEGGLIAIKRFIDAEGIIVSVYEQETNTNEAKTNELGRSSRSSAKAGKFGKNTLGGFEVRLLDDKGNATDVVLGVGTGVGLTAARRLALWAERKSLIGQTIKFKYQSAGTKIAPREPIFLGFRDEMDL